ncbi:MAG TPA: hypothetical protein VGP72_06445 [Planctomycetota bacterium]|jgi:hypothetical protein
MIELCRRFAAKAATFEQAAHKILSHHEGARSRVINVDLTRQKLTSLSLQQHDLFQQALECVEYGIFRAAHVMAWAGFADLLEEKLASDSFVKLHARNPAWSKYTTVEDLRENVNEYQLIEAARALGLFSKPAMKALHGLLSKRNECAHPSAYQPELNETLGYVSELLKRAEDIKKKTL